MAGLIGQLKTKFGGNESKLIAPVMDYSGFRSTDLVVEAIVENMDVKKKVLSELEGQVRESCVIATNTSSLSVTEMQKALASPDVIEKNRLGDYTTTGLDPKQSAAWLAENRERWSKVILQNNIAAD